MPRPALEKRQEHKIFGGWLPHKDVWFVKAGFLRFPGKSLIIALGLPPEGGDCLRAQFLADILAAFIAAVLA